MLLRRIVATARENLKSVVNLRSTWLGLFSLGGPVKTTAMNCESELRSLSDLEAKLGDFVLPSDEVVPEQLKEWFSLLATAIHVTAVSSYLSVHCRQPVH